MTESRERKKLRKISPSGWASSASAISDSSSDLLDHHLQRAGEVQHDRPAAQGLDLAGTTGRSGPQPLEQLCGGLAVGVVVGLQKRSVALLAQPLRIVRAWVAGQERERDRAVDRGEQPDRTGPEPL